MGHWSSEGYSEGETYTSNRDRISDEPQTPARKLYQDQFSKYHYRDRSIIEKMRRGILMSASAKAKSVAEPGIHGDKSTEIAGSKIKLPELQD